MTKRVKFTDRPVFNRVVCNEEVCRKLIRALIGLEVEEITYLNAEQSWEPGPGDRGVRMDVVARADGRTIDLEMQVARERHMGRRLRCYQAAMDAASMEPGDHYRELSESHIVFVCLEDPFPLRLPAYTIRPACGEAPELDTGSGMHWHVLNASAWRDEPDAGVREVLEYVKEGKVTGALTEEIDRLVERYNNDGKWVDRVLTWEQDREIQCGYAREEGFEQGMEQGENRFGALASRLVAEGRIAEVSQAADDPEARERLFAEFGL